jgi:hypothetical protein
MREKSKAYLAGGGIGSGRRRLHHPRWQPAWRAYFAPPSNAHDGQKSGRGRRPRRRVFGGGHMLTTDNYKCTGDRYKSILLLHNKSTTVFDETVEFSVTP